MTMGMVAIASIASVKYQAWKLFQNYTYFYIYVVSVTQHEIAVIKIQIAVQTSSLFRVSIWLHQNNVFILNWLWGCLWISPREMTSKERVSTPWSVINVWWWEVVGPWWPLTIILDFPQDVFKGLGTSCRTQNTSVHGLTLNLHGLKIMIVVSFN